MYEPIAEFAVDAIRQITFSQIPNQANRLCGCFERCDTPKPIPISAIGRPAIGRSHATKPTTPKIRDELMLVPAGARIAPDGGCVGCTDCGLEIQAATITPSAAMTAERIVVILVMSSMWKIVQKVATELGIYGPA
jgi:hypothetical protein